MITRSNLEKYFLPLWKGKCYIIRDLCRIADLKCLKMHFFSVAVRSKQNKEMR